MTHHIIIHPAWGYVYTTVQEKEELLYKYKIKYIEYIDNKISPNDKVYLFRPFLDDNEKKIILNKEVKNIIKDKVSSDEINIKILYVIINDIFKRAVDSNSKKISIDDFALKQLESSNKRKIFLNKILQYSDYTNLFYNCLMYSEECKVLNTIWKQGLIHNKINYKDFNAGRLSIVHDHLDKIYTKEIGNININIIGDWYNECAYSITSQLNEISKNNINLSLNTHCINEYCSFNNTKSGFKRHLLHGKNDKSFLSVSN
jgi:hypothetical protein